VIFQYTYVLKLQYNIIQVLVTKHTTTMPTKK